MYIDDICSRGKLPIIVGGTHYYIQSLIWDSLLDIPTNPDACTTKDESLDSLPTEVLYARLQAIDPLNPHHPNQRKRILGDLRLYEQTGIAPSTLRREKNEQRGTEEMLDNVVVWLSCQNDVLDTRLDKRVDSMVAAGMLEENSAFVSKYMGESDLSRGIWQAIGLKEFMPLFMDADGKYNGRTTLAVDGRE